MKDIQEIWRHWNCQKDFKATLPGIFKDLTDKIVQFQRKLGKNQVEVCWAFLPISREEGGEKGEREKQEEKEGEGQGTVWNVEYVTPMYPSDSTALYGKGNQEGHIYYYFQAAMGKKHLVAVSMNDTGHLLAMPVQKSSQVSLFTRI